jgi:hypothetical protein
VTERGGRGEAWLGIIKQSYRVVGLETGMEESYVGRCVNGCRPGSAWMDSMVHDASLGPRP